MNVLAVRPSMIPDGSQSKSRRILKGDGEMAELTRAFDWSGTTLGPLQQWPESLLTLVNTLLSCRQPMFLWWTDELIQFYNDAYRTSFGSDKHPKALGQLAKDCWPEIWAAVGPQLEGVIKEGKTVWAENRMFAIYRDGRLEETYWDYTYSPALDGEGEIRGILAVLTETTARFKADREREAAEQSLRASKEEFQLGMESASMGMWHYDPRTDVVVADERMHRIFGSPDLSGVVDYWLDLLHPEDREMVATHFAGALAGKHVYDLEYRILRRGEVRWVRSKGRVIGPEGRPERMFAIMEDITDRKQAEAALRQNEKLAAVGRLAASIAHEINNPLEAVTNLLYLIRGSHNLAEVREHADIAERELRRVALITNQTLRFHRQSTKPSEAFCHDLIGDSLSIFQGRLLNNHITVEKKKRAEHPVDCLASEIRQVLNNLIGNAIDAMPLGGRLLLRSREATDFRTGQRGLVITVADTGAGMNAETKSKLFEAFYTTKRIGGSGLGLWISKDIVDRHRGRLSFRSRDTGAKRGTVFTLLLPFES